MFRRGRRRKPRVQWLPVPGTLVSQNAVTALPLLDNAGAFEFIFGTLPGQPQTVSVPLVVDNPIAETVQGASLATYQNLALNQTNEFGWRLRRIVGDIFLSARRLNSQSTNPPSALVQAGIIVRRVGRDGEPAVAANEQDVGAIQNISDPWVWQRNWILSTQNASLGQEQVNKLLNQFPNTNVQYGTKHHIAIDQKTARRIGPEERLFMTVTAWELPLNQADTAGGTTDDSLSIYFCVPYRILGTVFTTARNRRNASR